MHIVKSFEKMVELFCKHANKFALYMSWWEPQTVEDYINWYNENNEVETEDLDKAMKFFRDEFNKACPLLKDERDMFADDGRAVIFYDTKEEVLVAFDLVVGDDGPTNSNPYNGPMSVYAQGMDHEGWFCENT